MMLEVEVVGWNWVRGEQHLGWLLKLGGTGVLGAGWGPSQQPPTEPVGGEEETRSGNTVLLLGDRFMLARPFYRHWGGGP